MRVCRLGSRGVVVRPLGVSIEPFGFVRGAGGLLGRSVYFLGVHELGGAIQKFSHGYDEALSEVICEPRLTLEALCHSQDVTPLC